MKPQLSEKKRNEMLRLYAKQDEAERGHKSIYPSGYLLQAKMARKLRTQAKNLTKAAMNEILENANSASDRVGDKLDFTAMIRKMRDGQAV